MTYPTFSQKIKLWVIVPIFGSWGNIDGFKTVGACWFLGYFGQSVLLRLRIKLIKRFALILFVVNIDGFTSYVAVNIDGFT